MDALGLTMSDVDDAVGRRVWGYVDVEANEDVDLSFCATYPFAICTTTELIFSSLVK